MALSIPFHITQSDVCVADASAVRTPSLLRRFFNALVESRRRQIDREIANYLATVAFTDAAEREVERRFLR